MGGFLFLLGLIIVVVVVVGSVTGAQTKLKANRDLRLRIAQTYAPDEVYVSAVDSSFVAFSFDERKVAIGGAQGERQYDYGQIAAVEVFKDGLTVTKTNRGSQALGATVGGLLFGDLGAVVGGLSGSTRARVELAELSLKITADDRVSPFYEVIFLRAPRGLDPNSPLGRQVLAELERVHAHFVNILRDAQTGRQRSQQGVTDVSDLHKLFEMRQAGALTEDEFEHQKAALLSAQAVGALSGPTPDAYKLVMTAAGPRLMDVIKALQALQPGLSLAKAAEMASITPATVAMGLSAEAAEGARQSLMAAGAGAEVRAMVGPG